MKKRIFKMLVAFSATAMLVISVAGCGKKINAGQTWEVTEITKLKSLTIADGAVLKGPEGKNLTMTVNGVETPIEPKTYKGDIVLTPTEDIPVSVTGMASITYHYRTAVYIKDGKYVPEKSVASAVVGGTVSDTEAKDVSITSIGEKFNGIIVSGDTPSTYSIVNPVINFTGNGMNDFAGFGASIMTEGKATVTIENAKIKNTGAVRTAVWVGGDSVTTINNSDIETNNGTLPADYGWSWTASKSVNNRDVMMAVPWMLGLIGNNRATNCLANGTANYNNTHIKAQAWGAMSTDACRNTTLNVTNCTVETVESGYGSYADGSTNTFKGTTFNVNDYGLIMTNGNGFFTDKCVVNSGRFGVMSHRGSGTVTIDKSTVFNTKKAVLQVKGGTPTFIVDNAELNSENGIILLSMVNDDPNTNFGGGGATTTGDGVTSGGMGGRSGGASEGGDKGGMPAGDKGSAPQGAAGGMPGGAQGGAPAGGQGGMPGGAQGGAPAGGQGGMAGAAGGATAGGDKGGMPAGDKGSAPQGAAGGMPGGAQGGAPAGGQGGMAGAAAGASAVTAVFRNVTLKGDIINSNTAESDVAVNLEKAAITGAITTAKGEHAVGKNGEKLVMQDKTDLYYLIGEETDTYCATNEKHGVIVSLDAESKWIVDKNSYLTSLKVADGASITAPEGKKVTMTVNGAAKPIKAGEYKGKIVLTVN